MPDKNNHTTFNHPKTCCDVLMLSNRVLIQIPKPRNIVDTITLNKNNRTRLTKLTVPNTTIIRINTTIKKAIAITSVNSVPKRIARGEIGTTRKSFWKPSSRKKKRTTHRYAALAKNPPKAFLGR